MEVRTPGQSTGVVNTKASVGVCIPPARYVKTAKPGVMARVRLVLLVKDVV
jgi:hypothetical protein